MAKARTIDDKKYWIDRHKNLRKTQIAGQRNLDEKANEFIYRLIAEQYGRLLNDAVDMKKVKSVLDAGYGEGYFIDYFSKNYPSLKVFGIDISANAKKNIRNIPTSNFFVGDMSKVNLKKKFDLVHCFDVLYHILDDDDYKKSLIFLAKHSNKYVVLHSGTNEKPIVSSKHIRVRSNKITDQILNSQGFFLVKEMPTHFFATRLLTYRLNKFFPRFLYLLDNEIAMAAPRSTQDKLASHSIKLYEKLS